ncbi:hypothetical protein Tsubulata_027373 [Turnera subulata]|uniref:Uncharacterized protein n=1 Tax=Turnera subulata TaxID=218843 RepID=A0A9Q0FKZ6_9ROSI|nr:hypothetical protein Tsubulata_027373 [Turnera subulata]
MLLSFVSHLIFTVTAHLFVVIIQGIRLPGQAMQGALEQLAEAIRACFEYILELIMEAISSLISSAFDLFIETITGSVSMTGSAVGGLMESAKSSLDELMKDLPELADGFSDMIYNIVSDMWDHWAEAMGYVKENA